MRCKHKDSLAFRVRQTPFSNSLVGFCKKPNISFKADGFAAA